MLFRSLHVPNWFLLGKETPPTSNGYWKDNLSFKIVSPGHNVMENEEQWIKDTKPVKQICDHYGDHRSVLYAIDEFNKYS